MVLSEITSYVVLMSFYIKMMKRRTLQACSLRHSIKNRMFSVFWTCLSRAVGEEGSPPPSPPTPRLRAYAKKVITKSEN